MKAAFALALALAVGFVVVPAAAVERFAVVVGANQAPTGRVPLRYAHDDARAIASVLEQVGDFKPENIDVLLDPEPERVLEDVDRAVAKVGSASESLVLFYYSGHSDSESLYPGGKPLALRELQRRLDDPRVSVRLGVVDSCRGGAWTGTKGLESVQPFPVNPVSMLSNVGSALISSSSGLEDAHESELIGGSFFTHHFSAGLRGAADENHDARVSLVEAFEYAKALTIRDTALFTSAPQHPSFRMNLQGRQDLPLANLDHGESWMALAQSAGPLQVVHLQSGMLLAELPAGTHEVRIAVPPGRYLVRRRAATQTFAKEYQVAAGDVTTVTEGELELLGESRLAAKGTGATPWTVNYYLFGGMGSHEGLGFSLSESQFGRIAPGGTSLTGFAGFAVANTGLGLEVSVPGRIARRFGKGTDLEWIPWLGLPYYFVPDAEGDLRFRLGVGAGLDAWLHLDGHSRVGANVGISAWAGDDDGQRIDLWGAVGYGRNLGDRFRVNVGLGYTHTLFEGEEQLYVGTSSADRISLGGVMTDGVLPLPLVEARLGDALWLGAAAQVDYQLDTQRFGYQATLVWTWRFGSVDMLVGD